MSAKASSQNGREAYSARGVRVQRNYRWRLSLPIVVVRSANQRPFAERKATITR